MKLHNPSDRHFASDNYAGTHSVVLSALSEANGGHQVAYGGDIYTAELTTVMRGLFGERAEVFPVFNGTGANVTALTSMLPRWGGIICSTLAHINTDEGGAPERIGNLKLMTVETTDGKLTPDLIDLQAHGWGDFNRAQPLVVSITQPTEVGTLYTVDEVRAIADHTHALGMKLHMDGARISNAAAALGVPLRAFTTDAGVDVLGFGGTKNGLMFGEAIVVLSEAGSEGLIYLRKLQMQLASKMRFVSAQFLALLADDLHLRSAAQANAMATRLRDALELEIAAGTITGLSFSHPTQANSVYAVLSNDAADQLRERFRFYHWNRAIGQVRWMTSFDTTEGDVDAFVDAIREALPSAADPEPYARSSRATPIFESAMP
jgi:threonine aldolase